MSDIVARLRDGIPSQSCDTDSVTFVRCGRGDCACEERLSKEAADEIERLQTEAGGVAMAAEQVGRIAERKMVAAEIERLRAALEPFLQYYEDIRFNLRKQPLPSDAAISESGERNACVTWAQFYALRAAVPNGNHAGEKS